MFTLSRDPGSVPGYFSKPSLPMNTAAANFWPVCGWRSVRLSTKSRSNGFRCRADGPIQIRNLARNQIGIRQLTESHGDVETFVHEIIGAE